MAQRIVTLCDAHAAADEDRPGATWVVTITEPGQTKATTWEVDLCDDDGKTLVDLAVMLGAVGRQVAGPKQRNSAARNAARAASRAVPAPGPIDPIPPSQRPRVSFNGGQNLNLEPAEDGTYPCPRCDKRPPTQAALGTHGRTEHGGVSLAELLGAPTPFACDVDGCGRAFNNPQGLGSHQRQAHGIASPGSATGS